MLKIPVFQLGLRSSPVQSESNMDSQQMGGICKPRGMGGPGASASWDKLCGEHQLMAEQLPWSPQHGRA